MDDDMTNSDSSQIGNPSGQIGNKDNNDTLEKLKIDGSNSIATSLKLAEEEHQYLREYIRNADQKAVFFFAICSGLLTFLHSKKASVSWMKPINQWSMFDLDVFLAMFCLTIAAALFLLVVMPRLKGSKRGLIFFNAIAEYTNGNDYASDVLRLSDNDAAREKLLHCYDLANICKIKYCKLVASLYFGAVGLIAALIYLLLS